MVRTHGFVEKHALPMVLFSALGLAGCGLPGMRTVQDAYRTDPVIVQYDRISKGKECFNPNKPEAEQREKLGETLCPVDLDTYLFPTDAKAGLTTPAYTRLIECQKSAAGLRYRVDADKTRRISFTSRDYAKHVADTAGARLQTLRARDASLLAQINSDDQQLLKLAKQKETEAVKKSRIALTERRTAKAAEKAALQKDMNDADAAHRQAVLNWTKSNQDAQSAEVEYNAIVAQVKTPSADVPDPETCRILRNFMQDEILTRSAQMCKRHLADTTATSAVINMDLGLANLAFSTLGAVVGGVQAKTNLAGLATASGATQTLVNKEIYREVVVPAITKAIQADRDRKLQEILTDQSKDVISYSVSRAIVEANDYHERCSFANGLLLLATDAEKRAGPRVEELEAQIKRNYDQIAELEKSIQRTDDPSGAKVRSSDKEIELTQKTKERLRQDIDAILVRINLMKRIQNQN